MGEHPVLHLTSSQTRNFRSASYGPWEAKQEIVSAVWSSIVSAQKSGCWEALTYDGACAQMDAGFFPTLVEVEQPESRKPLEITSVPRHEVEIQDDGLYSWRGYKKLAISFEDAYLLLNAAWREEQLMNEKARELAEQRKRTAETRG